MLSREERLCGWNNWGTLPLKWFLGSSNESNLLLRDHVRYRVKKHFWKNQEGSIAVMVAIMLTVLLGFGGLAIDLGNLYVIRTRMQSAVDAAVCAGGLKLTDQGQAETQANLLITANNFTPASGQPVFDPTNINKISYTLTNNVSTYFMGLFGWGNVPITVSAEAILQPGSSGPFNYTVFADKPLTLKGNEKVKGSLHSNDALTIKGNVKISGGTTEGKTVALSGNSNVGDVIATTVNDITITGNSTHGDLLGGVDSNITMPDYSQKMFDTAGTKYYTDKTFTGNENITGNIYVDGNVTIHGNFSSSGAIFATGNITMSGNINISGNNQVCLYAGNNITISGNTSTGTSSDSAIIYAPNGKVKVSGNSNFYGDIIANEVEVSGNLDIKHSASPITTLPTATAGHVKLIR